jgi:hypothetical protein
MRRGVALASVYGGFVAGTIDVFAPALIYMISPLRVMRAIAAGLIGRDAARASGLGTSALGMALQWGMSILIAFIFVFAATRLRWMTRSWILAGFAYGVVVFFVMNYVVRPLSAIGDFPQMSLYEFSANMAAMWLFGLIIAWFCQDRLQLR